MPRVIGIDPGTVSIDLCGIEDGRLFLDRSLPTGDALADPDALLATLEQFAPLDLIAGPSGYGLPLTAAKDLTEDDLRLACLAPTGEPGGIGGLRSLMRVLARSSLPVVLTPGVVHLASVPSYRKVNRVDMGTADKVCAAVLALDEERRRGGRPPEACSFILLELGGAFTAALAVQDGQIVDGVGGSSGAIGLRAAGALDGEVAFLAGTVSKDLLFRGGAAAVAGTPDGTGEDLAHPRTRRARDARDAYLESAAKAVASLIVAAPRASRVIVSGRLAGLADVRMRLAALLAPVVPGVEMAVLTGFATVAKQAAQGAALMADGLTGGMAAPLIETMGIRQAGGTVLDHLYVITAEAARRRLGMT
jgi:predicted butyrate kinase (DUF1464 family)